MVNKISSYLIFKDRNMKIKDVGWACGAVFLFFILLSPETVRATAITYEVNPADPNCSPTTSNPPCFTNIPAAILAAETAINSNPTGSDTYSIQVESGSYSGAITLGNGIDLIGRETTRTILNGASGVMITASNITKDTNIKNFTFTNSSVGVLVQSSSAHINIVNNIFRSNVTGVHVQSSILSQVVNNTFYLNTTGVIRDSDISVVNNIFSNNGTGISAATANNISFNDYFANSTDGPIGSNSISTTTVSNPNPFFVNTSQGDFHLLDGATPSPCINTGTNIFGSGNSFDGKTSDIGAYGGPNSDTIPFIISGVTFSSPAPDSVNVSWSPNNSYIVTNTSSALQGGYNVYYSFNKSGQPYDNKVTVLSADTSTLISGLTTSVSQPSAPFLNEPGFGNGTLSLSWSFIPEATGYLVHFTDLVTSVTNTINVGNTTSYTLSGLINGRNYSITVSAVAQPTYHFSVTAFDYTVKSSGGGTPGVAHESAYLNPDLSLLVGTPSESSLSNSVTGFPEAITPNPDLPNTGCFIATAAYGHYSAPQVQALREFRDRYLMTNSAGQAFVAWYYRYGPIGAEYLNAHEWLKPVVRTALLPAVGGALFMTRTSLLTKAAVLILTGGLLGCLLIYRRKLVRSGGPR
jgi:hypothetical protein